MSQDFEITGSEHIGTIVSDIEKSKEFYCGLLGMKVIEEKAVTVPAGTIKTCFVELDNIVLDLEEFPEWDSTLKDGLIAHVCFRVKNIKAAVEYLRSKGVKFDWENTVTLEGMFGGNIEYIFFRGPDNEMLELCERLPLTGE